MRWLTPLHEATGVGLGIRALAGASPNGHELLTQGQSYTMAVVGAEELKITYDLTLWCLFRRVKPPEEAMLRPAPRR